MSIFKELNLLGFTLTDREKVDYVYNALYKELSVYLSSTLIYRNDWKGFSKEIVIAQYMPSTF